MFNWIRSKVKSAVLAGFADAVEHLKNSADDVSNGEERLAGLIGESRESEVIEHKPRGSRNGVKA